MASSRWKRFAFFERQTLAIPDSVLDDLCISSSETAQSLRLGQQQSQRSDCRVSLSVNTASLPAHTNPVVSAKSGPGKSSITTMTMDSKNNPLPTDSVTAMWASLTACSAIVSEEGDSTAAVSMTNASGSIALASQGQALTTASTSTLVNTTTGTGTAATGSPVLDGLVLAFVASPDSSRVHCIDITVRCNPSKTGTTTAVWPNSALSFIEDMDGWRGYWSPFTIVAGDFAAAAAALNSAQQQQLPLPLDVLNSSASSGIVAIASCRVSNATTKNHGNRTRPMLSLSRAHSSLHVACLKAQHELTVWEDPHLHLTCQQPMQDKAVGGDANVYTTAQAGGPAKWNVDNDGLARALDIVPGMVAVGTETGVVLIYIYNASLNALASSRQQQQLLLRPYLRIPAPPTTGVQVVSVQLSLSNDKANVFVAYNRMISSPTGASSSNMSASTTAGICCYDLPLPTLAHSIQTQPFLAAPSARHDLDGRYVGMESLVDSYSQANSEHVLTVVSRQLLQMRLIHCISLY